MTKDMVIHLKLNHLHLRMLYVKYGGTWLGDSEEVNMWRDMDSRLDGQIDNEQQVFSKAALSFKLRGASTS